MVCISPFPYFFLHHPAHLERLEPEVVVFKVASKHDGTVDDVGVFHDELEHVLSDHGRRQIGGWFHVVMQVADHISEELLCLLVEVGHGNARGQLSKVGVFGGEFGGDFSCELVQLHRGDALVHALSDALGHHRRVHVFFVQAIAEFLDAGRDLVKVDPLPSSVALDDKHVLGKCDQENNFSGGGSPRSKNPLRGILMNNWWWAYEDPNDWDPKWVERKAANASHVREILQSRQRFQLSVHQIGNDVHVHILPMPCGKTLMTSAPMAHFHHFLPLVQRAYSCQLITLANPINAIWRTVACALKRPDNQIEELRLNAAFVTMIHEVESIMQHPNCKLVVLSCSAYGPWDQSSTTLAEAHRKAPLNDVAQQIAAIVGRGTRLDGLSVDPFRDLSVESKDALFHAIQAPHCCITDMGLGVSQRISDQLHKNAVRNTQVLLDVLPKDIVGVLLQFLGEDRRFAL